MSYHLSRTLNFSHYIKMPNSNFNSRATEFDTGVGKCSCGQTFECASEREIAMKCQKGPAGGLESLASPHPVVNDPMHSKFCSKPLVAFNKIRVSKKATTLKEHNSYEAERMRKVHKSIWMNITQSGAPRGLPFLNIIRRQLCIFRN